MNEGWLRPTNPNPEGRNPTHQSTDFKITNKMMTPATKSTGNSKP